MIAVLYCTKSGHTKKIVDKVAQYFNFKYSLLNVKENPCLDGYDLIIIFCPTYGDEELPLEMEDYLVSVNFNKNYAVCELGNYFGFDDFEYGASHIIKSILDLKKCKEVLKSFSLDSFPKIEYNGFEEWCQGINQHVVNKKYI